MVEKDKHLIGILIIWISIIGTGSAFSVMTIDLHGCQGRLVPNEVCTHPNSTMKVKSVTIYASADSGRISSSGCFKIRDCHRTIHSAGDNGLADNFQYLYQWIVHKCEGKKSCNIAERLPEWWKLTGAFINDKSSDCPDDGIKYFTALHAHIQCIVGVLVPTKPPPPETTPYTTPTTPAATEAFPVYVPIYVPTLLGREKIVLGVALGLSIAILVLLLIILYCCEWYRSQRRLGNLLQKLGAPQAASKGYVDDLEEYRRPDRGLYCNPDCMAEFTGVKPDEFVTIDKRSLDTTAQYIANEMTMRSTNSCSTMNKGTQPRKLYGQTNPSYEQDTLSGGMAAWRKRSVKKLTYDSAENLEMERRMAIALGLDVHSDDEEEMNSYLSQQDSVSELSEFSGKRPYSPEGQSEGDHNSLSELSACGEFSCDNRELHVIAEEHSEDEEENGGGGNALNA